MADPRYLCVTTCTPATNCEREDVIKYMSIVDYEFENLKRLLESSQSVTPKNKKIFESATDKVMSSIEALENILLPQPLLKISTALLKAIKAVDDFLIGAPELTPEILKDSINSYRLAVLKHSQSGKMIFSGSGDIVMTQW